MQHAQVNTIKTEESLSSQAPRIQYSLQQSDYLCKPGGACVAVRTWAISVHLWAASDFISSNSPRSYIYIHTQKELGTARLFHHKLKVRIAFLKLKRKKIQFTNITTYFGSRNQAGFFLAHSAAAVNTVIGTRLKLLFMKYETEQKAAYVPVGDLALQG